MTGKDALFFTTVLAFILSLVIFLVASDRAHENEMIKNGYQWIPTVQGHYEKVKP
jgi:hypothetical protein